MAEGTGGGGGGGGGGQASGLKPVRNNGLLATARCSVLCTSMNFHSQRGGLRVSSSWVRCELVARHRVHRVVHTMLPVGCSPAKDLCTLATIGTMVFTGFGSAVGVYRCMCTYRRDTGRFSHVTVAVVLSVPPSLTHRHTASWLAEVYVLANKRTFSRAV